MFSLTVLSREYAELVEQVKEAEEEKIKPGIFIRCE